MKWAPTRNAAPASSDMLRANLANEEAALSSLESERLEIVEALPGLVAEPERSLEAQARLREIEVLVPSKRRTVDAVRAAIPDAEAREERDALEGQIAEQAKRTAKLRRDIRARYSKAADAFAAVLVEIKADNDEWSRLNMVGGMAKPRMPTGHSAEWALRAEGKGSWRGSVTDGLVIRDFDGRILFK